MFQGSDGKVYGDVSLAEDLTLANSQKLEIPEGSILTVPKGKKLNAGSQGLTNNGTLMILGTVTGTITGDGAVVRGIEGNDSVASYGNLYYSTLEAAITAANSAADGGTVTLLKDATLSTALDEDVTLSVSSSAVLTVGTDGLTNLAKGTLEVKAGGGLKLGTGALVGTDGALNLTNGSVTMKGDTVTLTSGSEAEIPSGKTFYLMLGSGGSALNAVIGIDAKLTVNGTLKAVSGSGESGSQVAVKGTLDVKGTLTIALQADVTVENGGTLNLPAMTKETMGSAEAGQGMKGDIIVKADGNLTYANTDVLGGTSPLMNLTEGTATLNLGNANAAEPFVSLTLNGTASVASDLKALWVTADGQNTFVPMNITVASGSKATVPADKVLNLVNGSSLTVEDTAKFEVAGILEVHSTAKFDDTATVSGKVYVFEATNGTNPISDAAITLTSTGAVYAEKTALTGTTITPARMTESDATYTSTSATEPTTFAKQWTLSYKITLDANGGTLAGGVSELWTNTQGNLIAMPSNPIYRGYTFNGWYDAATGGNKVGTDTVFNADTTIYAQWTYKGSSDVTTYAITVKDAENGTVTCYARAAEKGAVVTVTVKPDVGYALDKLTVTDASGNVIDVEKVNNTTYTFVMPGSKVTVEAVFAPTTVEPSGLPFTDVSTSDWFYSAVKFVYENGLMDGVGNNLFAPNATLNRAMAVTILYRLEGSPDLDGENLGYPFADVDGDTWYSDAVYWARLNGIVDGVENNRFNPTGSLTREQMATILYRYAQYKGADVSASGDLSGFVDSANVSSWAADAVKWAVGSGLVNGVEGNALAPQGTSTRAQAATVLMRFVG